MWALTILTKAGVGASQIVVGVTSYGRSFEMTTEGCYDANCRWDAAGRAGECTDTAGYISHAEMSQILSESSDSKVYTTNVTDILVYNSTQWVGYMTNKTKVVRQAEYETYNFAGTAKWAIDLEKFVPTTSLLQALSEQEDKPSSSIPLFGPSKFQLSPVNRLAT
jgi:chitinase